MHSPLASSSGHAGRYARCCCRVYKPATHMHVILCSVSFFWGICFPGSRDSARNVPVQREKVLVSRNMFLYGFR